MLLSQGASGDKGSGEGSREEEGLRLEGRLGGVEGEERKEEEGEEEKEKEEEEEEEEEEDTQGYILPHVFDSAGESVS